MAVEHLVSATETRSGAWLAKYSCWLSAQVVYPVRIPRLTHQRYILVVIDRAGARGETVGQANEYQREVRHSDSLIDRQSYVSADAATASLMSLTYAITGTLVSSRQSFSTTAHLTRTPIAPSPFLPPRVSAGDHGQA